MIPGDKKQPTTFNGVLDANWAVQIKEQCHTGDTELDHMRADEILCEILKSIGLYKTVEAFKEVNKNYA